MKYLRFLFLFVNCVFINVSCNKEDITNSDCDKLKRGLTTNDTKLINKALDDLLTDYNEENLQKLTASLSGNCDMTAAVFCYNCIYTLPAESEVHVTFSQADSSVLKVLDISHTQANKMVVVGVHE